MLHTTLQVGLPKATAQLVGGVVWSQIRGP